MISLREVVITGVGVVSPIGIGREPFWKALRQGISGVGLASRYGPAPLPSPLAAELKDFDPKQYVTPRKSLKVMSQEIQMGFAAAVLAMQDAGLAKGAATPERFGVIFGSEMFYADNRDLVDLYAACMPDGTFEYELFGKRFPNKLYPLWMLKYLPNMAACHVGIAQDARGPNNTLVLGEVSSLLALIEAAAVIQRDQADVMIVGGTSSRLSLTPLMYRGGINLSQRADAPEQASRPFDRGRDGAVNGEGAGAVILESRRHAMRRNAPILARLVGSARTFGKPTPDGSRRQAAIEASMQRVLQLSEASPKDIDHVNAHGLSTPIEDVLEAQAIRHCLADVPVTALKSYFGNLGPAGGMVELAGSVLALQRNQVPATLNYTEPDPQCPVRVIQGEPKPRRQPLAMVLSQSRTGQAAAVLLGEAS